MEKKKVSTENPISVNGLTLMPVVKTAIWGWGRRGNAAYAGYKRAVIIVTVIQGIKKAYRTTGEEISLEELVKEYPEVKDRIEGL
jgi:hypothetical protein